MKFQITSQPKYFRLAVLLSLLLLLWQTTPVAQAQSSQDKPFTVEYSYKVKWGHAEEFIRLFKKNHYPLLKKQIELKNALQVTAETPVNHGTEAERWDYRVRIVWKNVQIAHDDSGDEAILKQLFPDQETFKREEQKRFEILLGHWDIPVMSVNLVDK